MRIALFAGLAVFMGRYAAFVRAFLAFSLGLFATGLLRLLRREGLPRHEGDCTSDGTERFDELHIVTFKMTITEPTFSPPSLISGRRPGRPNKRTRITPDSTENPLFVYKELNNRPAAPDWLFAP